PAAEVRLARWLWRRTGIETATTIGTATETGETAIGSGNGASVRRASAANRTGAPVRGQNGATVRRENDATRGVMKSVAASRPSVSASGLASAAATTTTAITTAAITTGVRTTGEVDTDTVMAMDTA